MANKQSSLLVQLEASIAAKYQRKLDKARLDYQKQLDICLQMGMDAACIAANDVLHMGSGRAWDFLNAYKDAFNTICRMITEDSQSDPDIQYSTDKIDKRLKSIIGEEHFSEWEVRYG